MKVLFLAHRIPFPPNKGDKIRSFNILNRLAKRHDVYLACLVDDPDDLRFVSEAGRGLKKIVFERIRPRVKKLFAWRDLLQSRPLSVGYFYSAVLQQRIDAILDTVEVDAIMCFSSPMAEYLIRSRHADGRIRRALRVMDLIDVDSAKWRQYAEQGRWWATPVYRFEARHLAEYERRIARDFDHVLVVSEQEMNVFPGGVTPTLAAMPNGVDLAYFRPDGSAGRDALRPAIVFTGAMDYRANVDGIEWFVESVFPLVRAAVPEVELSIVGGKPTRKVRRLARVRGVTVTGYVDDVRDYLIRASACIAPLRVARGIQNKVLEAMAAGKAVICTPQAHEGIDAVPGEELVVADGAKAFAAAAIDLLLDHARARRIGLAARQCVEKKYSWDRNLALLDEILDPRRSARGGREPRHERPTVRNGSKLMTAGHD